MLVFNKLPLFHLLVQCLFIKKINCLKCYFCQNCVTGQTSYVIECPEDVENCIKVFRGETILKLGCEENQECIRNSSSGLGRYVGQFPSNFNQENIEETVCCEYSKCNFQVSLNAQDFYG